LYLGGRINIEKVDEHSNKQEPRNRDPEIWLKRLKKKKEKKKKKKKRSFSLS